MTKRKVPYEQDHLIQAVDALIDFFGLRVVVKTIVVVCNKKGKEDEDIAKGKCWLRDGKKFAKMLKKGFATVKRRKS